MKNRVIRIVLAVFLLFAAEGCSSRVIQTPDTNPPSISDVYNSAITDSSITNAITSEISFNTNERFDIKLF